MSLTFSALAKRLPGRFTAKPATRGANRTRLGLQELESREVPVVTLWTGDVSTDANDPDNWTSVPGAGDTAVINGEPEGLPGFPSPPSVDCYGLSLSSGAYAGLVISSNYTGTVTFGSAITTGTFYMYNGIVAQPNGYDLTVNDTFTWTAGVLNNLSSDATVYVNGGGSIAPASAGTVYLGSTMIFTGTQPAPKETTIDPGTIALGAIGGGLIVAGYATLTAKTYTSGDILGITKNQAGAQTIEIQANGTLGCVGPGQINYDLPVGNFGIFNLTGSVRVNLTGQVGPGSANYAQTGNAQLRIENGSVLNAANGVNIGGGVLFLMMNSNLPANQQTATINGNIDMTGGTILFASPITIGTALTYGTFTVNGNVNWTGGTYKPSVDYTTAGLANKWVVNGTLTSAAACIVEPNPQRGTTPPASSNWTIVDATNTAGTLPGVATGTTLTLGQFTESGRKVWKLASP